MIEVRILSRGFSQVNFADNNFCNLSADNVTEIKRGAIAKHFWPDYSEVAKAMDEASLDCQNKPAGQNVVVVVVGNMFNFS
jgi:hypothetical protein